MTDLGRQYTGSHFNELLKRYEIQHKYTTANNPTGNSISERANRSINEYLRIKEKHDTIQDLMDRIQIKLNWTYNRNLECSPYEIFHRHNPLTKEQTNSKELLKRATEIKRSNSNYENKERNRKRKPYNYKINDIVMIKTKPLLKLDNLWEGPGKIIKIKNNENTFLINLKKKNKWINIKNMRPFGEAECSEPTF